MWYFKEDQKVFEFINNNYNKISYSDFVKFLINNDLPFRERWAFYFFGKNNLDEYDIENMSSSRERDYGGFIHGEIYYWTEYIKSEWKEKEKIKNEYVLNNIAFNDTIVHVEWVKKGWVFAWRKCDDDTENEVDRQQRESCNWD